MKRLTNTAPALALLALVIGGWWLVAGGDRLPQRDLSDPASGFALRYG